MSRSFSRIRLVVVQSEDAVYFDKYYTDVVMVMEKFSYFCQLANVNHKEEPGFVFDRTDRYNEMSMYFPANAENELNQSGFTQVSMYFEVG